MRPYFSYLVQSGIVKVAEDPSLFARGTNYLSGAIGDVPTLQKLPEAVRSLYRGDPGAAGNLQKHYDKLKAMGEGMPKTLHGVESAAAMPLRHKITPAMQSVWEAAKNFKKPLLGAGALGLGLYGGYKALQGVGRKVFGGSPNAQRQVVMY